MTDKEKIRDWIEDNVSMYHIEDIDDVQDLIEEWEQVRKTVLLDNQETCKDCTYETMLTDKGEVNVLVGQCGNHKKASSTIESLKC